ncbi:conserved hypothetical protein [Cytophaga hutchinsonii ATCC 33406]|jgi:hypothetical protein|uniref:DUF3307 domain-containing protein n=2 Tax=Cytophaga hutchinsonii TaxID=985 RepID=A0A6N4SPU1_CYTH3|nr:conserved hypothetical protein [Cytophaga hutchinsonii ATCC 33406]SFX51835.1 Protein of unknown function [Cytophaga hutchinsonii ATCC 33406]
MDNYVFFTEEQGNILIRLLLAHLLSDFVFQTKKMVAGKSWFSRYLIAHAAIVYLCTALFTGWWVIAFVIAASHYIIDGLKIEAQKKMFAGELVLFVTDQILHIAILIFLWAYQFDLMHLLFNMFTASLNDYTISLVMLGYLIVTTPAGYVIAFTTKNMMKENSESGNNERGGKNIGIYERIIILTFVLLGQYEAIGFLITGKSIIRFVNKDEHIRSEYVLLGTMMSYMFAIVTGVLIKLLLADYN